MQINYHQKDLLPETLFEELEVVVKRHLGQADGENEQVVKMKDDIIESAKKAQVLQPCQVPCEASWSRPLESRWRRFI